MPAAGELDEDQTERYDILNETKGNKAYLFGEEAYVATEEIGTYDPLKDPSEIIIDNEAAKRWLANGAQPTDTVRALLKKSGAIE